MIAYEDILNLNFYTYGQAFSGSYKGMRYKVIQLKEQKDEEGNVISEKSLETYIWPEPFGFDKTADDQKIRRLFPFSEEGRRAVVDWLNEMHEKGSWEGGFTMSGLKALRPELYE